MILLTRWPVGIIITPMSKTTTATAKQVSYALSLLDRQGFSTTWMNASFSKLGATMRQRSGKVTDGLGAMSKTEISKLIGQLQ